jgi:hypothetical protein
LRSNRNGGRRSCCLRKRDSTGNYKRWRHWGMSS